MGKVVIYIYIYIYIYMVSGVETVPRCGQDVVDVNQRVHVRLHHIVYTTQVTVLLDPEH